MPLDSSSQTWVYDGSEAASPFKTMLNLLAASVRDSINSIKASFADSSQGAANWAYNSCFDIWQRGTSFTATGWTADRWNMIARVATTVGQIILPATDTFYQTRYAAQLLATAATNSATLVQSFTAEDVAEMRGRQVIFAVRMVGLNAASAATISIQKSATPNSTTLGSWTPINSTTITPGTAGSTATVTATIPADTTAAGIRIAITTNNNPNGYGVNIGRITFKPGTTLPVEHQRRGRSIQGEEREAKTFYTRFGPYGSMTPINTGQVFSTTLGGWFLPLPVRMRAIPTNDISAASGFIASTATGGGTAAATSISSANTQDVAYINISWGSAQPLTAGNASVLSLSATSYLGYSAELP